MPDVDPREFGAKPVADHLGAESELSADLEPRFDSAAAFERAAKAADGGRVVVQGGRFWLSRPVDLHGADLAIGPGGDLSRGL